MRNVGKFEHTHGFTSQKILNFIITAVRFSHICIHFSSQLCMLHVFAARPPGFYLTDNIVNSKIMRSFTTGFSYLFVTSVLAGPKMFLSVPCKWSRD